MSETATPTTPVQDHEDGLNDTTVAHHDDLGLTEEERRAEIDALNAYLSEGDREPPRKKKSI
jgi:hypothetical protein